MAVDPVAATTTPPVAQTTSTTKTTATTDAKEATLNYDSFLKLLVAQMKNQDPTDPIDASQQMSQLATFSSVEQAIKTNSHLESLIQETSMSQAASLIGKTITSVDGKINGLVKAVEINSDGLTAVLENGEKVLVTTGIKIAAAGTTDTDTGTDPDTDNPTDPAPDDGETDSVSGE